MSMGPCMCGATDCPSCGPAQGYYADDEYSDEPRFEWNLDDEGNNDVENE